MKFIPVFLNILFLFAAFELFGQAADSTKIHELDEVIVTAQYVPQTIEKSVYKVKTIDAGEMRSRGVSNLRELLQHELNINLEQRSVFGTSIEVQGISKENVKILVDGVPVIGRLNGIIDLSQINLYNIERVEIIEGPASVFYGTGRYGRHHQFDFQTKTSHSPFGKCSCLLRVNRRLGLECVGRLPGWQQPGALVGRSL